MSLKAVIDDMAENGSMTKREAERALEQVFDSMDRVLFKAGDKVVVPGFGKFERKMTTRTSARNPRTGQAIAIVPRLKTHFTEAKSR